MSLITIKSRNNMTGAVRGTENAYSCRVPNNPSDSFVGDGLVK